MERRSAGAGNRDEVIAYWLDHPDLLRGILELLDARSPHFLAELREAVARGEDKPLERVLGALKL
jgi:hypothetical protein